MNKGKIIAQQIGNRAFFMLGAKNLVTSDEGVLTFRVGRNSKSVNVVRIELQADDTYLVECLCVRQGRLDKKTFVRRADTRKMIYTSSQVYADQLHAALESGTGMYTSL